MSIFMEEIQKLVNEKQISCIQDLNEKEFKMLRSCYVRYECPQEQKDDLIIAALNDLIDADDHSISFMDVKMNREIDKIIERIYGEFIHENNCQPWYETEKYLDDRDRARDMNAEFHNAYSNALYGDSL